MPPDPILIVPHFNKNENKKINLCRSFTGLVDGDGRSERMGFVEHSLFWRGADL